MSNANAIRTAITGFARTAMAGRTPELFSAEVIGIDPATRTCSISTISAEVTTEYTNVRLMPDDDDGLLYVPKKGSTVLIAVPPNQPPYVVMWSALDQVQLTVDTTSLTIDKNGYSVKRDNETLKAILTDLMTAIKALTVPTPAGTSGVPVNIAAFDNLATRIGTLLT